MDSRLKWRRWLEEGYLVTKGVPIGAILYQDKLARAAEKIDIALTRGSEGRLLVAALWHPPYSSIVVVVPAAVPAAPVMWTVIVAVPTSIAIVGGRVVVISMSVVPVRAIIVRAPPAPSPRITNPANLVDIGWRCRGRRDRHGAGAGCGERANCSGGCNSKDGFSHVIPHRIEDAA
jgi:hypothetical protein